MNVVDKDVGSLLAPVDRPDCTVLHKPNHLCCVLLFYFWLAGERGGGGGESVGTAALSKGKTRGSSGKCWEIIFWCSFFKSCLFFSGILSRPYKMNI
jgi:hypothetical protein